jgi:hypothetical protein
MKLFLLRPNDNEAKNHGSKTWTYDCSFGVVVRAKDEQQARLLAASVAGDEGEAVWLDPALTSCSPLKSTGQAGVVLQDFLAG